MTQAVLEASVRISTPHVYLTGPVIEQLFCDRYRLHVESAASQPPQFAAQETVTLVGPAGRLHDVRVMGPARSANQVEISSADALVLGLAVPVRESGDLNDTPGIILEGPRSQVRLKNGVIRARRHLHMNTEKASSLGLQDDDRVSMTTEGVKGRMTFDAVLIRVSPENRLELHLDSDEADAAGLHDGDPAVLLIDHAV